MTTMQNQQKNWGDIMRLHAHIQKQREDFEHQLHRERQTRYKEELDSLLVEKNNMKRMERNGDVELRKRIENDYEQYKHQAILNKHTMKDVQMMFAEDNFRDHYSKKGQEKELKQMEAVNQQERGNAIAELDRMQKLQEKEEKHALLSVQRKDFEDNNKFKHFTQEKQKEQDKQYMDDFAKTLENQHANRQKFFESIRKRGQNPEVMEVYRQYYSEENQRRQEHEKNVIEKARVEKLKKEEEMARRKQLEQERMKHETLNALSYQMQTKKEMDHINRQKELDLENKQLHDTVLGIIEEHDRKMKIRKEFKEKTKSQHVEALNKQLEDLRNRKHNEDILTPLEERFNKNDINILDNRAGPVNLFTSPSFVPGRNLGFERKLQNHYINKALHINNPLSEAHRAHSSHHQEGGSVFPQNSERDSKLPPQSENPYLQAVAKQTLPQSNGYDMQPQNNARADNSLELQQPRYNMPELAKARYTPQYAGNNQPGGPNERLFDDKTSATPQINNRMRSSNESSDYNNQVFRSMQDLRPSFSKDYQYIKSKNGIHANPVNIISNELKAPTAYLRNPYSIY